MSKGITKLLIVHLKETSIVKKGGAGDISRKIKCKAIGEKKKRQSLLPCCFLATISQANISFLQADQAWSLDWDVLGLREVSPEHKPPLTCSAQSNLPGTTVSTCRPSPQEQIQA